VRLPFTLLLAVVALAAFAADARANGDPASDVLPFSNVFLSIQNPKTSSAGRELEALTAEAAKKKFPIRVAVIAQPSDLGLIQSLWRKPQPYANFLGRELIAFGRYHGTLVVAMPNGFGVFGPGAKPRAKRAVAALPEPGGGTVDDLGAAASDAVRRVAAANGYRLTATAESSGGGTSSLLIVGAALAGAAVVAAAVFFALRRWLTRPAAEP
jgi:hypothetical protein